MKKIVKLNEYIDHTNLRPDASDEDIIKLCREAMEYNFKAVCVNPCKINVCIDQLKHSNILICTVVGFPLGQNTLITKIAETINAVENGADEIDMVINISELKKWNKRYCIREINEVVAAAKGKTVKVIVETGLLSEEEKILAFQIVNESNAQFIKTSTGFANKGAQPEDIKMWSDLRDALGSNLKIKAAGGISNYHQLIDLLLAGSDRIGSSKSISILKGADNEVVLETRTEYKLREIKKIKEQPEDSINSNESNGIIQNTSEIVLEDVPEKKNKQSKKK